MCFSLFKKKKDIKVYPIECGTKLYKQNKNVIIFEDRDYMDRQF
jgi:hypothetical protein